MPLQCGICEGIRIVPMLLDVLTLKRNKFRDPRIINSRRTVSRMGDGYESANLMTRSISGCTSANCAYSSKLAIG